MPIVNNRQYRNMAVLSAAKPKLFESAYYVEGYATTWQRYPLWEDENGIIYEQFCAECFNGVDLLDVIMQFDHAGKVFARTSNNTLKLIVDDKGLFIAADLSKTEPAKEMYNEISCGMIAKMSWSFIPDEFNFDEATRTIIHSKIKKIFDVSAVSIPANDTTSINTRNFVNGEIDKIMQERLKIREKQKLALILKIGGID